jgi:hypothetical protein
VAKYEADEGTEENDESEPDDAEQTEPEPEPDDTEPEPEPEPDAAPEADSYARVEEIGKQLDKLRQHVAKRLGAILGDDAPFYTECELCTPFGVPGFRPPVDLPPEVQGALYHLLGQHAPSDYQPDKHSTGCPSCNGFGEVATGSKIIGQDRLPCVECNGNGWQATDDARRSKIGAALNGPTPAEPAPAYAASVVPDISQEDEAEVARLRGLGYAVIPPMTVRG